MSFVQWVKLDRSTCAVIEQSGSLKILLSKLNQYCIDSTNLLSKHCVRVGRTIDHNFYEVFVWNPYQQLILTNKLTIRQASDKFEFDITEFWTKFSQFQVSLELTDRDDLLPSFLGYYGYLSYEISWHLDTFTHRKETPRFPFLVLEFPTQLLIRSSDFIWYIEIELEPIPNPEITPEVHKTDQLIPGIINHSTSYQKYITDLRSIISSIQKGDIYQANYTQHFKIIPPTSFNSANLFNHILSNQRLPHAAYLNYSNFQIFSLSPELFLQVENGRVMTRPIKGTRPRGQTDAEDQEYIQSLRHSTKDAAELSMIVDLLRNDLGKSALPGSVEVDQHAEVETYENVHHLVSTVSARIDSNFEASLHLLLRALPGGSISGVPKQRALEIIDHHEPVLREIYTGIIGFLGLNGDLEFNIAIRTAVITQDMIHFNSGGGIVYDSDPLEEYLESLHKAKHLAQYFDHSFSGHLVRWQDKIIPADHIIARPTTDGLFETILVEQGKATELEHHLQRLQQGIDQLNFSSPPLPHPSDIHEFIRLNLATQGLHRLNISVWKDPNSKLPIVLTKISPYSRPQPPITLYYSAQSFDPPQEVKKYGIKTLDYAAYRQATQEALDRNCWDGILVDEEGYILEGGRSTLYFYKDHQWFTPQFQVVHGIIRSHLLSKDRVELRQCHINELQDVSAIAISNSLLGIEQVMSIVDKDGSIIWKVSNTSAIRDLVY